MQPFLETHPEASMLDLIFVAALVAAFAAAAWAVHAIDRL